MEAIQAFEIATANSRPSADRFYGPVGEASVGTGFILNNVEYPIYLVDEESFGVVRGLVVVLTHECDLDPANERVLNDAALICPVIPLEDLVADLENAMDDANAASFIAHITARNITRLLYLPIVPDALPLGGYLYLNLITNTHYSKLVAEGVDVLCMMTGDGLRELDHALEAHLRRPKADRMPFQVTGIAGL